MVSAVCATRDFASIARHLHAQNLPKVTRICREFAQKSLGTGRPQGLLRATKNPAKPLIWRGFRWWAWPGLNLLPLRCQHSALPLSYTPTVECAYSGGWEAPHAGTCAVPLFFWTPLSEHLLVWYVCVFTCSFRFSPFL